MQASISACFVRSSTLSLLVMRCVECVSFVVFIAFYHLISVNFRKLNFRTKCFPNTIIFFVFIDLSPCLRFIFLFVFVCLVVLFSSDFVCFFCRVCC